MFQKQSKNLFFRALAGFVSLWLLHAAARAQEVKYLPDKASIAVQLRPRAALAEPSMFMVPKEVLEVFGRKELGLNLLELDRLLFVVGEIESLSSPEPPGFALVAEFSQPQTPGGRLMEDFPAAEEAGGKVWRLNPFMQIRQLNPQTLVVGKPDFLEEVIQGGAQPGVVGEGLLAAAEKEHLTLVVDMAALRPALEEVLPPEDQVPPPFRGFLDLPELVTQISLRHSFSPNGISELRLDTGSEQNADRLERLMRAAINNVQQLALPLAINEMRLEDEEYQQAWLAFGERLAGVLKQGVETSRSGNTFAIDLKSNSQFMSVSLIGTLTGLLLPAVQSVREAARRTESSNNLRQILLGLLNYESAYQKFPPQAITSPDGRKLLSWRVAILPFLDEMELYKQFRLEEPWDSEHNLKLLDRMPEVYRTPAVDLGNQTLYLGMTGPGTTFEQGKQTKLRDVLDGLSNTIGIVEANPAVAVPWTKPEDLNFDPAEVVVGLGGVRPGSFLAGFLDGSTRIISDSIDRDVLRRLFLINDGEPIGDLDQNR